MEQNESKEARKPTENAYSWMKSTVENWNNRNMWHRVFGNWPNFRLLFATYMHSLSLSFSLLALYRFLFITITNVFTGESVRIHLVCVHRVWIKYESNKEPDREYNERVSVMLQPCNMHIAQHNEYTTISRMLAMSLWGSEYGIIACAAAYKNENKNA